MLAAIGRVHRGVRAVRGGAVAAGARRVPRAAGPRRRNARPRRHDDDHQGVPAGRADQGQPDTDRADAARPGARSGDRRRPGGRPVLALDLLHQPAGRRRRASRWACCSCPRAPSTRRAGSTCPASCWPAPGSRCSCTRCRPARRRGWGSPAVLATGLAGLVLLAVFLLVERRAAEPLLRLRLYRNRLFRITSLQATAASGGFIGTLFLVPLLLQNGLGFSAVHSGLSTFTEALGGMTGVQVTTPAVQAVRAAPPDDRRHVRHDRLDRPDGAGRPVRRGLADPGAHVLHRLLVRLRDVAVADREHGHHFRGGDRARLNAAQHGQAGGRRRPASRCSAPCSPRPERARPTWPATGSRSSPRPA